MELFSTPDLDDTDRAVIDEVTAMREDASGVLHES